MRSVASAHRQDVQSGGQQHMSLVLTSEVEGGRQCALSSSSALTPAAAAAGAHTALGHATGAAECHQAADLLHLALSAGTGLTEVREVRGPGAGAAQTLGRQWRTGGGCGLA